MRRQEQHPPPSVRAWRESYRPSPRNQHRRTRRNPPAIHRGDLLTDLPGLAAQAPPEATLVVYHSAVLAYVAPADRESFAATVRGLGAVWLSNEAPGVVPGVTSEEPERCAEWGKAARADGKLISVSMSRLPNGATVVTFSDLSELSRFRFEEERATLAAA